MPRKCHCQEKLIWNAAFTCGYFHENHVKKIFKAVRKTFFHLTTKPMILSWEISVERVSEEWMSLNGGIELNSPAVGTALHLVREKFCTQWDMWVGS